MSQRQVRGAGSCEARTSSAVGATASSGEALTGFWRVVEADSRLADLREPIAERAKCMAGLSVDAQSNAADAASATRPDRVEGAWFRDGETRMDDQQHALAALIHTIPIAEARERSARRRLGRRDAVGWLWAIVLVLALNPARAAFGVPRTGRSATAAVELAALGGAIGAVAVCAASALAPPLLDALDVSDPAFRIAAGVVALLTGAADLFRRPPPPEPALPGRRAALIPVASPGGRAPGAAGYRPRRGCRSRRALTAASMVIAVALLVLLTGAGANGRPPRPRPPLGRPPARQPPSWPAACCWASTEFTTSRRRT